jgi:hypothetical protein
MHIRVLTAAIALVSAGVLAQTTIPVPAGSTDSGARAVVGIAPVDTSIFVQRPEIPQLVSSATAPWSRAFPGQAKAACGGSLGCGTVYIDGDGYMSWRYNSAPNVTALGFPSNSTCVGQTGVLGAFEYNVSACPAGFDYNGRATNWYVYFNSVDISVAN